MRVHVELGWFVMQRAGAAGVAWSSPGGRVPTLAAAGVPAAIDQSVILLHLPLPLAGDSTAMERARQRGGSLAD